MQRIEKNRVLAWASGKAESELDTVLNSTFCHKLLNALGFAASLVEEHPTLSHQPFYDSLSDAKVQ